MKKKLHLFLFFLFCSLVSYAQTEKFPNQGQSATLDSGTAAGVKALLHELEGSFRIEYSQPNYQILYTGPMLERIKAERKDSEEVRIQWDSYTTIIIYARRQTETNPQQSEN